MHVVVSLLLLSLVVVLVPHARAAEGGAAVNIVLVGATGNLAKKYLWQALFDLKQQQRGVPLRIFGAGTSDPSKGIALLKEAMEAGISCALAHPGAAPQQALCAEHRSAFMADVQYFRLKKSEDFGELHGALAALGGEIGRLFYLSIPPSIYSSAVANIHAHAHPVSGWLRVAVEKPFGHDLESARTLATSMRHVLREEELFRVDHYLGKPGVVQMAEFLRANHQSLAGKQPTRIRVAMLEREDCNGRTKFYEETGVIRDVLQNHLTEMLFLVADGLTNGDGTAVVRKHHFISSLHCSPPLALGQYDSYRTQVTAEGGAATTMTPTFAAAALRSSQAGLEDTVMLLWSGKNLPHRTAFAEVEFSSEERIYFHIQGHNMPPHVSVYGLSTSPPLHWGSRREADGSTRYTFPGHEQATPYLTVLKKLLDSDRAFFVDTESLLASWHLWNHVLKMAEHNPVRVYQTGDPMALTLDSSGHVSFSAPSHLPMLFPPHPKNRNHGTRNEL